MSQESNDKSFLNIKTKRKKSKEKKDSNGSDDYIFSNEKKTNHIQ